MKQVLLRSVSSAVTLIVIGMGVVGMGIGHAETPVGVATAAPGSIMLPHDLSPLGMFMGADRVVKGVLIGLALASIMTWTVALAKFAEIMLASTRARTGNAGLQAAGDMAAASAHLSRTRGVIPDLVRAAGEEVQRSGAELPADGIKERIASRFQRIEAAEVRRMMRGTGVLATIGATAPFVGLFGTVWGIMNSFIGISKAHTTNLAVVAPGIAEALLATAVGLIAAIPAVVVYNLFSRALAGYRARVGDASAEIMRTVSRDLDRQHANPNARATARSAAMPPRVAAE